MSTTLTDLSLDEKAMETSYRLGVAKSAIMIAIRDIDKVYDQAETLLEWTDTDFHHKKMKADILAIQEYLESIRSQIEGFEVLFVRRTPDE